MSSTRTPTRLTYAVAYTAAFAFVASSAALSSVITRRAVQTDWYVCIRPRWTPPPAVFGAVWSLLYVLLFVALGTTVSRGARLGTLLLVSLLLLNVLWCFLYFALRWVAQAAVVLILIAGLALYTVLTLARPGPHRLIPVACCVAPYAAWVCFAALLNTASIPRTGPCSRLLGAAKN